MLLLYVLLTVLGLGLTARLVTWRSPHALTAGAGTMLAAFAVVGGFSIGVYVAPVALFVLALAVAPHLGQSTASPKAR
jgi:hypothetical protein